MSEPSPGTVWLLADHVLVGSYSCNLDRSERSENQRIRESESEESENQRISRIRESHAYQRIRESVESENHMHIRESENISGAALTDAFVIEALLAPQPASQQSPSVDMGVRPTEIQPA